YTWPRSSTVLPQQDRSPHRTQRGGSATRQARISVGKMYLTPFLTLFSFLPFSSDSRWSPRRITCRVSPASDPHTARAAQPSQTSVPDPVGGIVVRVLSGADERHDPANHHQREQVPFQLREHDRQQLPRIEALPDSRLPKGVPFPDPPVPRRK